MAYNFLACDRDQAYLLPPDVRDWLPADHPAWFMLDVVGQLDLGPFLKVYRVDGHGRAAYQPRMLPGVLLYGYCTGVRSSRQTSGAVERTSPSACWPATASPIM
jgi:transposase